MSFLVVDDFSQMRVSLKRILQELGVEDITLVGTGREAMRALTSRDFHITLCDFNLGEGKDGQQVLEEARHLGLLNHSHVFIMITGDSHLHTVMSVIENRPDGYLVKPFSKEMLAHRLGQAYGRKGALAHIDSSVRNGDFHRARQLCDNLAAQHPRLTPDLDKLRVEILIAGGELEQADQILEDTVRRRSMPWALFYLGKVSFLRGNYRRAEELFERLLEENRYYVEAYDWLSRVQERLDCLPEAQRSLQFAVELAPKSIMRQRRLAELALGNGDHTIAEHALRAAVRNGRHSHFNSATEYINLADFYSDAAKAAKALIVLRDGIKHFSGDPGNLMRLWASEGELLHGMGRGTEAGESLNKALDQYRAYPDQASAEVLIALGRLAFLLERDELAVSLMGDVVRNYYDDNHMLSRVYDVFFELEKHAEGADIILEIKDKMTQLNNTAVRLFNEQRLEEAVEVMVQAAEGLPHSRSVNLNAVRGLLVFMRKRGKTDGMLFRTRQYIERLREGAEDDPEYLNVLSLYREMINH